MAEQCSIVSSLKNEDWKLATKKLSVGVGDKSSESSDYDSDGESELAGSYTTDSLTSAAGTECTSSTVIKIVLLL